MNIINRLFSRGYWEEADGGDAGDGGGGGDASADGGDAGDKGADGGGAQGLMGEAARRAKAAEGDGDDGGGDGDDKDTSPNQITVTADDLSQIPEQFVKDGAVNAESLIKSWKDTRAQLKELQQTKHGDVPEDPSGYEFQPPEGLEIEPNDAGMEVFKAAAHKAQLSPEQFKAVTQGFLEGIKEHMPEAPPTYEEELAKLGKGGDALVQSVVGWGQNLVEQGILSEEEQEEVFVMGSTATGIRALAKLRELAGEKAVPMGDGPVGDALPSKEELYARVADSRYGNDPAFTKETDKMFKQVFGDEAAGSSQPGLGVKPRRSA